MRLDTGMSGLYSGCNSEMRDLKSFGAEGVLVGTEKLSSGSHAALRILRSNARLHDVRNMDSEKWGLSPIFHFCTSTSQY